MNVNPLVFSNNTKYRVTRHVLFWLSWILYFTIFMTLSWMEKFPFWKSFLASLPEETLPMPLDMIFCYSIIYFLIPRYLSKGKYIQMVLWWLFFSVLVMMGYRLYNIYVIPHVRAAFGMPYYSSHSKSFWWEFFYMFSQINMEGCMTAAIKLGKMWYIKQQELDLLKKEKQKIEPQMQSGKIQPVFLINALNKVGMLSAVKPTVIPGMIQKIKSLLLYIIYDNNLSKVKLEKELKLLEEYVELEKEGSDEKLNVSMKVIGNTSGEQIAPFIIIPLAENSFRQLSSLDLKDKFIDLEIRISEGVLYMLVAWSKPVDSSTLANGGNAFLNNIAKRLELLYPQSHELKVVIKTNQFIIDCKIDLHGAIN
ncbi:MAG TPA: histidine kinase [Puia sp.]|nr:histidine kinase [Puia sp.]